MGRRSETNPKTYSLRIHSEAYYNLRHIFNHIAFIRHQPLNAFRVYDAIHSVIEKIPLNLLIFKVCEEIPTITNIYRRANCLSWSIIFRISGSEVVILGIIHQASKASRVRALRKRK